MTHKNGLEKPHVIKVVDNPTPEIWDPSLASLPVRLVVPIIVVEELDDLLHDRQADRRKKARTATRALLDLHQTRPMVPVALRGQPDVTIEVLLDGDWHERRRPAWDGKQAKPGSVDRGAGLARARGEGLADGAASPSSPGTRASNGKGWPSHG